MRHSARKTLSLLLLLAMQSLAQADVLKDHQGTWLGEMKIPNGTTLRIGAELLTRADGTPWASIAVPDQATYDAPVHHIRQSANSADLDLGGANLTLTWAGDHFNGEFQEAGGPRLAFPLRRVDGFPRKARPQTPKAPFPYREETVAIASVDGVTLGATLSVPHAATRPNLIVLVNGSGPASRDANGTFLVLADALARDGIAVLRYDKRGIARSTGNYDTHTKTQLADDLHAIVQAMQAGRQFNRVGVLGHSEGAGVGAAVAARDPASVDFLVSLAGVGLPGLEMMLLQDRATALANGATPAEAGRIVAHARRYYDTILTEADGDTRIAALKALEAAQSPADAAVAKRTRMDQGSLSVDNGFAGKEFLRVTLLSDTPRDWRGVQCPVLALNGTLDHQVPLENLAGIVASLKAGGNRDVRSDVLPSLNHLFQTAKTGAEDEYATIEEIMSPLAMDRVATFVVSQR